MRPELTFDGFGINGPDEYRSRVATFTSDEAGKTYGNKFAAAPAMYEALKELVTYLQDHVEDAVLDNWAPVLKAAYALAQAEVKP